MNRRPVQLADIQRLAATLAAVPTTRAAAPLGSQTGKRLTPDELVAKLVALPEGARVDLQGVPFIRTVIGGRACMFEAAPRPGQLPKVLYLVPAPPPPPCPVLGALSDAEAFALGAGFGKPHAAAVAVERLVQAADHALGGDNRAAVEHAVTVLRRPN